MTINERINEIKATELKLEDAKNTYYEAEAQLVDLVGTYVLGRELTWMPYGSGKIMAYSGTALDNINITIEFENIVKKFNLSYIIAPKFKIPGYSPVFTDAIEIGVIWEDANAVHSELTKQLKDLEKLEQKLATEAKQKAEAEKKAEEKYQAAKEKALRDFNNIAKTTRPKSSADEFYYSLGWLAKYAGTVAAAMPDYLADAFAKHFGAETPCRVVDSKKVGPSGYTSQWTWSFSVSLKKPERIPATIAQHLNPAGKAVTDTTFVWDLVDKYGFKFGKTQDIDKIRGCIPSGYMSSFEAGLA